MLKISPFEKHGASILPNDHTMFPLYIMIQKQRSILGERKYGMFLFLLSELSTNEITSIDFKFYNTFAPKNIGYLIFESDNLKCQKVFFYTYLFDFYLGVL